MNLILCALWAVLAAGWFSGIALIATAVGGYQWIEHFGQSRTVGFLAVMGIACVTCGVSVLALRRLPRAIASLVFVLAGLHLFNAVGTYILYISKGQAGMLGMPFILVSSLLPTKTQFIGMPASNASLFILPSVTLLATLASLRFLRQNVKASNDV